MEIILLVGAALFVLSIFSSGSKPEIDDERKDSSRSFSDHLQQRHTSNTRSTWTSTGLGVHTDDERELWTDEQKEFLRKYLHSADVDQTDRTALKVRRSTKKPQNDSNHSRSDTSARQSNIESEQLTLRQRQIKDFVRQRNITRLVHFTHSRNLDSIMSHGIVSRAIVDDMPTQTHVNDELRLDRRENTISVSISFPNYKMFYKCRKQTNMQGWAVIELKPDILWTLDCLFCCKNAACSEIANSPSSTLAEFQSLRNMFPNTNQMPLEQPHDPQAEVLVCENIPVRQIISVHFDSRPLAKDFQMRYPTIRAEYSNHYFKWRENAA